MEVVSFFVPALYVAALIWAVGGDFLRAQVFKDLEQTTPWFRHVLHAASLPTLCLVGALLLRLLIREKGLLLTALLLAVAIYTVRMCRVLLLRRLAGPAGAVALSPGYRRLFWR